MTVANSNDAIRQMIFTYMRNQFSDAKPGEIALNIVMAEAALSNQGVDADLCAQTVAELVADDILQMVAAGPMFYLITEKGHSLVYGNAF